MPLDYGSASATAIYERDVRSPPGPADFLEEAGPTIRVTYTFSRSGRIAEGAELDAVWEKSRAKP